MERRNVGNLVYAALFILVCSLPLAALLAPNLDRGTNLNEKRELAPLPAVPGTKAADLPAAFEDWFNDHFGYRSLLVRWHGLFQYRIYNASSSQQVLPGRDSWLFYDGRGVRGGDPRRNHLALLPAEHQQLFRKLKEQFEHNDRYFAQLGITYLVVIVPDKWSVYSEQLPASVGEAPAQTSADLFLAYLRAETDLKILDLKRPLRELRREYGPIYHRIDSHWNELGAYLAAGEMARFVGRFDDRMPSPETVKPPMLWEQRTHGDLASLLGLDGLLKENEPRVSLTGLPELEITNLPKPPHTANANRFPIHTRQQNTELPRLLILRDSYGDALLPSFSRSFSEARWVWTSNAKRRDIRHLLDETRPDFVIEEKAEKYLMFPVRYYTAPGRSAVVHQPNKRK